MMRTFRSMAPWLMFIMAITFIGWMVFEVGMNVSGRGVAPTRQSIAKVNGTSIDYLTYQTSLQTASEQRSRQGAGPQTLEDQKALGDAVMEDLIREILLRQELARRNITVTDDEIRNAARNSPPAEIEQAPEFQTDGKFDMAKYTRYLSTNPRDFLLALESRYRAVIPQSKLVEELASTVYVPTPKLWRMYQDQNDSVTAQFALIQPDIQVPDSAVKLTDQQLQTYYNQHRDDFKRPATAYLSFIAQPRMPNAGDSAVARDSVNAVRKQLAAGEDFIALAKRVSDDTASALKGGDLGETTEGSMIPVFEKAALALKPGQISQPVLSQFGWHIIKLENRDPKKKTYHVRHILIAVALQGAHRDKVEARVDSLDRYAAEQKERSTLDSIARKLGLPVVQAPPLAEGNRMQLGRFVIPDVGVWAFTARPGETSQVIETEQSDYVFRLDSLHEEGIAPYERAAGDVRIALEKEQKAAIAHKLAEEIAKDVQGGTRLKAAAEKRKIPVTTFGPFTRLNPPAQIADAFPVIGAAFGLGVGQVGGPYDASGGIYFVEPVSRKLADSTKFAAGLEQQRLQVLQAARRDRVQQVVAALREDAKVDDRRRDLEKAQREAEDNPQPVSPLPGRRR
jgi:peptidyl-prolyl cis-trans isomerase D